MTLRLRYVAYVAAVALSACTGYNSSAMPTTGAVIKAGNWNYAITANVPLSVGSPAGPPSCVVVVSGIAVVSGGGAFSIPFSGISCNSCTMSGGITGIVSSTSVSGSAIASTSGSGCSQQQPSPSPAAIVGTCTPASCQGTINPGVNPSFGVAYVLTPP